MAMAQLAEELIVEILLWLSVKSLKRFICVSKELCGVIDSPNFINSHFSRSSQNINHRSKLIFPDRWRMKFDVCDFPGDETLRLRGEEAISSVWGEVCGNCKDLLFLYRRTEYRKYRFALWNPSTRQYRDLPYCPFKVPANVEFYSGLGYDDSTGDGDYKAILKVHVSVGIGVELHVWIYVLKSNMWRRASNFPYIDEDEGFPGIGYFVDGSMHWICTLLISGVRRKEIVAFDMRKETFSLLPQPAICLVSPKLHVLEGSLCVSSKPAQFDLFIRKKDGAEKLSWTKLFSLKMSLPSVIDRLFNLNVLGYSKRGDKILIALGGKANMVVLALFRKYTVVR